jgi:hypothetical protein
MTHKKKVFENKKTIGYNIFKMLNGWGVFMKKYLKLALLLLVLLVLAGCSWGWLFFKVELKVKNDTVGTITSFYIRASGTENWGENRLSGDLSPGKSITLLIKKNSYDFQAMYEDSIVAYLEDVNLNDVEIYTLSVLEGGE